MPLRATVSLRVGGRVPLRTRWLLGLGLPAVVPLLGYVFLGRAYVGSWATLGGASLVLALAVGTWLWLLDQALAAVVRRWPGLHHTRQRVLFSVLVCCGLSGALLGGLDWFFIGLHPFGSTLTLDQLSQGRGVLPSMHEWLSQQLGYRLSPVQGSVIIYIVDVLSITALVSVYEAFYLLGKWKESKLTYEQLRRASLQSQLQSLRGQINPHFLFNTLNSLSSLIAESPRHAELFVDEIAKVYRYLLQTAEGQLTSLATELEFIESYYHLLRTRHGASLELHIQVAETYLRHQLPPLTLQMLVENAVKHNIILPQRPLRIDIATTPGGQLSVRNNYQPKSTRVDSTRVGLSNIQARYQLLAQASPEVLADDQQFTVTLPLLAPP